MGSQWNSHNPLARGWKKAVHEVVPDKEQDKKRKIVRQLPKKQAYVIKLNVQKKARFSYFFIYSITMGERGRMPGFSPFFKKYLKLALSPSGCWCIIVFVRASPADNILTYGGSKPCLPLF